MREIEKGEKNKYYFVKITGRLYDMRYHILILYFYDIRVFKYLIFFHHNNPIMGFTFHQLH